MATENAFPSVYTGKNCVPECSLYRLIYMFVQIIVIVYNKISTIIDNREGWPCAAVKEVIGKYIVVGVDRHVCGRARIKHGSVSD